MFFNDCKWDGQNNHIYLKINWINSNKVLLSADALIGQNTQSSARAAYQSIIRSS